MTLFSLSLSIFPPAADRERVGGLTPAARFSRYALRKHVCDNSPVTPSPPTPMPPRLPSQRDGTPVTFQLACLLTLPQAAARVTDGSAAVTIEAEPRPASRRPPLPLLPLALAAHDSFRQSIYFPRGLGVWCGGALSSRPRGRIHPPEVQPANSYTVAQQFSRLYLGRVEIRALAPRLRTRKWEIFTF